MSFLSWAILGVLAGSVAGWLTNNNRSGCLYNIFIGVLGAFIGGFVMQFVTGESFAFDFDIRTFIVAVLGSVILLFLTGATRPKGKRKKK